MTWTNEKPSRNAGLVWMRHPLCGEIELRFVAGGSVYTAIGDRLGDLVNYYTAVMWHPWSPDEPKPEPPVRHVPDMVWCDAPDRPGWWQMTSPTGLRTRACRWDVIAGELVVDPVWRRENFDSAARFRRIPDTLAATLDAP